MVSASMESLLRRSPALVRLRLVWSRLSIRRRTHSLRLLETISLGEKRFVAVLEFEGQRFLIGVTTQSISLLRSFGESGTAPTDTGLREQKVGQL
jgi:flagellar biogenesis protein FliO